MVSMLPVKFRCMLICLEMQSFRLNEAHLQQFARKITSDIFVIDSRQIWSQDQHCYLRYAELAGRYASKASNLQRPIFSVQDYLERDIPFHIFFKITQNLSPVSFMSLLLYDNYETDSPELFSLRYEWSQPIGINRMDCLDSNDRAATMQHLTEQIGRYLGASLSVQSQQPRIKMQLRQFTKDPVITDFTAPLYTYAWDSTLSAEHPCWNMIVYSQAEKELNQTLIGRSAKDCLQNRFPEVVANAALPVMLSYWDTEIYQTVQVPIVDFRPFRDRALADNPLGEGFVCLHFTGEFPEPAKELTKRLTQYLSKEIECNARYNGDHGSDLFLIMSNALDRCYGYVLLKNVERSPILRDLRPTAHDYLQKKPQAELTTAFFRLKQGVSKQKLDAAYKAHREDSLGMFFFRKPKEIVKYEDKYLRNTKLQFFAAVRSRLPTEGNLTVKNLEFAWIHPFYRAHGLMTRLWNHLHTEFNHLIEVDKPSFMMRQFIEKNADASLNIGGNVLATK